MDTLTFDLLKLIDNRLEAKCSCLLGLSTGVELFLSGYDQFDKTQTKWFLQYVCSENNIWISEELAETLDLETLKFIHLRNGYDSYGMKKYLINKMIKDGNFVPDPQKYTQSDHDIHDLCEQVEVAIKYNKTKIAKQLVNVVLGFEDGAATRYNYTRDDSIYARHGDPGPSEDEPYYVITYMLTEAYKYNRQELVIQLEELYNKLDVHDLYDKYYTLIGLLAHHTSNGQKIIPLLKDLRTDKLMFDKVFRGTLRYCNVQSIDFLLQYCDGDTRKDKLRNIGEYARDEHLYGYSCDDEFHELYVIALNGSNTEIAHDIYELVVEYVLNTPYKVDVNHDFVYNAILKKKFDMVDTIIKTWESEWIQLFSMYIIDAASVLSVEIFDYLRSRFNFKFNLLEILYGSWEEHNYKLFKRVCDIMNN